MTRESFWNQWARRITICAVLIAFGSTALLYIPGLNAWSEILQLLQVLGLGLLLPAVILSRFHYNAFIENRMAEGMSKKEARNEYRKRFPSHD